MGGCSKPAPMGRGQDRQQGGPGLSGRGLNKATLKEEVERDVKNKQQEVSLIIMALCA